jgi:hypothetical protein
MATEKVLQDLDQFEKAWTSANIASIWEIPCPGLTPPVMNAQGGEVTLWSTVLYYQSLSHANIVTLGSAIRLLLLIIYRDISHDRLNLGPAQILDQLMMATMTICRSVDYYFEAIQKGASSHSLFYPLKIAFKGISDTNPALGNWLKRILDQLSDGFTRKWITLGMSPL